MSSKVVTPKSPFYTGARLGLYLGSAIITAGLMGGLFNFIQFQIMRWWQKKQINKMVEQMQDKNSNTASASMEVK